jgi:hypothetical protein
LKKHVLGILGFLIMFQAPKQYEWGPIKQGWLKFQIAQVQRTQKHTYVQIHALRSLLIGD